MAAIHCDAFLASGAVRPGARLAELLDTLFVGYARLHDGGTTCIGNKKGVYAEPGGLYFKEVFPDAKFVFIVRDPRDAIPSMISKLGHSSARQAARLIARRGAHIRRMCNRCPEDFHVVRYEDLVLQPVDTCDELCTFLGLEPSTTMLDFHKPNEGGGRLLGNKQEIHRHTQGPLDPSLVARWRQDASAHGTGFPEIEAATADFMTTFGYEPAFTTRGRAIRRIARSVRSAFLRRVGSSR